MESRVLSALRFGAAHPGLTYMPTGGQGRFGPPEAELMARMLTEHGVDAGQIEMEPTGRNTIGSVLACARLLRGRAGPVYAATSGYHLVRCVMLLRMAGLDGRPCPPLPATASRRFTRRWFWRLREVAAVPVDAAIMLWRGRGR